MKDKTGKIIVVVGPMYSGKTTELLTYVEIYRLGKKRLKVFKPALDHRYGVSVIRSHSGMSQEAHPIEFARNALDLLQDEDAVFFDEIQFFDDSLVETVKTLRHQGRDVILAGLDMSFKENPFDTSARVMAIADEIVKKKAVCNQCGEYNALISYKIDPDEKEIDVGGMEKYVAVCLDCYDLLKKKASDALLHQ